jgi:hypothetical protein
MKRFVLVGIGLVMWVYSLEARAEYMTGGFLAGLCASVSEDTADAGKAWESGGCVGYIVGVADALDHQHWEASGGLDGGEYCMPSEASRDEILEVVIASLHENPDNAESLAVALVYNALIDTFDCSVGLKHPL